VDYVIRPISLEEQNFIEVFQYHNCVCRRIYVIVSAKLKDFS
jgi:hypothetical protein